MNRLWAPWRKEYVTRKMKERGCLFCEKFRSKVDRRNFVISRTRHSISLLNIYPYQNGHVMIAPKRHVKDLKNLNAGELLDLVNHLIWIQTLLQKAIRPGGFNIGINLGKVAGAGIASHIHIHIVPRWQGDHNFMPLIGQTKIISESLDSLYNRITHANKKTA